MRPLTCLTALLVAGLAAPAGAAATRPDPMREAQWGLSRIDAATAWRTSTGKGVVVAVVDTGIDLGHPDLRGKLVRGVNIVDPTKPPQDDHGHGTHVAGIVAAATSNGIGIAGVAPNAKLMPVKVLDRNGSGSTRDIATGVRWAVDHGAKVVNLSLSAHPVLGHAETLLGTNAALHSAVAHAWAKGAVVVVAAGNSAVPLCSEPAAAEQVVCVGAVGPDDMRATYSQGDATTTKWFVCAPGGAGSPIDVRTDLGPSDSNATDILSTVGRGTPLDEDKTGYVALAGTSMAAPHVSGIVALLLARRLGNAQAVTRLLASATDLGAPGTDSIYGSGLVNAAAAVRT